MLAFDTLIPLATLLLFTVIMRCRFYSHYQSLIEQFASTVTFYSFMLLLTGVGCF